MQLAYAFGAFWPSFLCSYALTFLNDPCNLKKKIFWFVFLSNDNLLPCNTGLDEVETRMFDILYPLCAENMANQQTLELSRVRFSAIGVTLPCVSNQEHGGVSVSPFNRPGDDIYQQTQARAKTEAASNLYFKDRFNVL